MPFSHEEMYKYLKSCVLCMLLTINSQPFLGGGVGLRLRNESHPSNEA